MAVKVGEGDELEAFGQDLATEVVRRYRSPVQMMHLKHGIFDEAPISLITTATGDEIGKLAAQPPDVRRFRPNILITSLRSVPFEEDEQGECRNCVLRLMGSQPLRERRLLPLRRRTGGLSVSAHRARRRPVALRRRAHTLPKNPEWKQPLNPENEPPVLSFQDKRTRDFADATRVRTFDGSRGQAGALELPR